MIRGIIGEVEMCGSRFCSRAICRNGCGTLSKPTYDASIVMLEAMSCGTSCAKTCSSGPGWLSTCGIDRITARVRALATGTASTAEGRTVVDDYCRRMRLPRADDAVLEFLMTPKASRLSTEDVDELLQWGELLVASK
jgi:hypothetical protein